VLVAAGLPTTMNYIATFLPMGLVTAIEKMSLQTHFESMQKGILSFADVSYFALLIVGCITANAIILEERKAN
jgi:ABC-2 type transport system permease protein